MADETHIAESIKTTYGLLTTEEAKKIVKDTICSESPAAAVVGEKGEEVKPDLPESEIQALPDETQSAAKPGAEVELKGGRRRSKRRYGKKGAKKSRKGAKQSKKGGRRSSKNRRKHSHRSRKH